MDRRQRERWAGLPDVISRFPLVGTSGSELFDERVELVEEASAGAILREALEQAGYAAIEVGRQRRISSDLAADPPHRHGGRG